jgi:hypothetical protein
VKFKNKIVEIQDGEPEGKVEIKIKVKNGD